jgi:hypothetical protein
LGSTHTIVSALANIANHGQNQTLTTDLNEWTAAVDNSSGQQYWLGKFTLNYTLRDTRPYIAGLYVSPGTTDSGVSEAYVSFQLNVSGSEIEMQRSYYVNVSSSLYMEGFMTQNNGTELVAVSCSLFNDGEPALAKNLTIYYRESTEWVAPNATNNNYVLRGYGNGTYTAIFNVETNATSLDVSARVFDARQILVQATCNATKAEQ